VYPVDRTHTESVMDGATVNQSEAPIGFRSSTIPPVQLMLSATGTVTVRVRPGIAVATLRHPGRGLVR